MCICPLWVDPGRQHRAGRLGSPYVRYRPQPDTRGRQSLLANGELACRTGCAPLGHRAQPTRRCLDGLKINGHKYLGTNSLRIRCAARSSITPVVRISAPPSGSGKPWFEVASPAVGCPKNRTSGRALKATATASPELAVLGPMTTAIRH